MSNLETWAEVGRTLQVLLPARISAATAESHAVVYLEVVAVSSRSPGCELTVMTWTVNLGSHDPEWVPRWMSLPDAMTILPRPFVGRVLVRARFDGRVVVVVKKSVRIQL